MSQVDGLTRGELRFGIVKTFNPNPELDRFPDLVKELGDGSKDMRGIVQVEGELFPFDYWDGRFPLNCSSEDDLICFDEVSPGPSTGIPDLLWPTQGSVIMVEVENGQIRRWTYPSLVLSNQFGICDSRYVQPVAYDGPVEFPGIGCVVDFSGLSYDEEDELLNEYRDFFPGPALYIGYHTDLFLSKIERPKRYAVFTWDWELGQVNLARYVHR